MMPPVELFSAAAPDRPPIKIAVQHFGSISGGKDSQAVLCKMVERIERKGREAFGNGAPCLSDAESNLSEECPDSGDDGHGDAP